jgi:regulator of protease activity HflC (stomatin/prohibitin superfamily)
MKRLIRNLLPILPFVACVHVDPGSIGVKVESCSGGGVQTEPVPLGYHAVGPCTSIIEYPVFVQTAVWTHTLDEGHPKNEEITFTNSDQMQVAVDVSLAYQLDPNKASTFYTKFKAANIETWTHGFLRNLAREKFDTAAGKYKIEQIMGDNAGFLKEVRDSLQKEISVYGVTLTQFGLIGAPRPPQSVVDSINAKAGATQKAMQIENELKQAEAEARKVVAQAEGVAKSIKTKADAEAYYNQKIGSSITPALVEYIRAKTWDGKMPVYSGNATPLIQIK